jgi:AcrR family transcriptional regulator
MRTKDRRAQVVQVALDVIAERGVQGTTLTRIADRAGVTTPALYAHFANKKEIMTAALDELFVRIREVNQSSQHANAIERLRENGLRHSQLLASQQDGFVFPLFEFLAAPPEEDLRGELRVRQLDRVEEVAEIVRDGQKQGSITLDVDPHEVAWLITVRSWAEDVAQLMGVADHWNEERSNRLLDLIVKSIVPPDHPEEAGSAAPRAGASTDACRQPQGEGTA